MQNSIEKGGRNGEETNIEKMECILNIFSFIPLTMLTIWWSKEILKCLLSILGYIFQQPSALYKTYHNSKGATLDYISKTEFQNKIYPLFVKAIKYTLYAQDHDKYVPCTQLIAVLSWLKAKQSLTIQLGCSWVNLHLISQGYIKITHWGRNDVTGSLQERQRNYSCETIQNLSVYHGCFPNLFQTFRL